MSIILKCNGWTSDTSSKERFLGEAEQYESPVLWKIGIYHTSSIYKIDYYPWFAQNKMKKFPCFDSVI